MVIDPYCLDVVGELKLNDVQYFSSQILVNNWKANLNSLINIAVHPIGRTKINFIISIVMKDINPAMFKVPVNNAPDRNIVTHPRSSRDETTYASHDQVDFYVCVGSLIELLDDTLFKIV